MGIFSWFKSVQKFTLVVHDKEVWDLVVKQGVNSALIFTVMYNKFREKHNIDLRKSLHVYDEMYKKGLIGKNWQKASEHMLLNGDEPNVFRGIRNATAKDYHKILKYGTNRFTNSSNSPAFTHHIDGKSNNDFIWATTDGSTAWRKNTNGNFRIMLVYDQTQLNVDRDLSPVGYGWKLKEGYTWKSALKTVYVVMYQKKQSK